MRRWQQAYAPSWPPGRQPTGPIAFDRTHPLAKGLLGCWIFRDPVNHNESFPLVSSVNLVTGKNPTLVISNINSSTTAATINAGGRAVYLNDGYFKLGPSTELYAASSSFGLIRRMTTGAVAESSFGNDASMGVLLPWSDSTVYWDYPDSGSRVSVAITPTTLMETWLLHGGATGRGIWLNGKSLYQDTTTVTTAAPTGTLLLNQGEGVGGQVQEFNFFCTWGRQLNNEEIIAWSADPYCFIMPAMVARRVGVAAAAGRGLFRQNSMTGLGAGGPFFSNPLG